MQVDYVILFPRLQLMTPRLPTDIPKIIKRTYQGLKKFISAYPNLFYFDTNHNFNPKVHMCSADAPNIATSAPFQQAAFAQGHALPPPHGGYSSQSSPGVRKSNANAMIPNMVYDRAFAGYSSTSPQQQYRGDGISGWDNNRQSFQTWEPSHPNHQPSSGQHLNPFSHSHGLLPTVSGNRTNLASDFVHQQQMHPLHSRPSEYISAVAADRGDRYDTYLSGSPARISDDPDEDDMDEIFSQQHQFGLPPTLSTAPIQRQGVAQQRPSYSRSQSNIVMTARERNSGIHYATIIKDFEPEPKMEHFYHAGKF
jgi:hypothetical protein